MTPPSASTNAQCNTDPPMVFPSSFFGVIDPFASLLVVTAPVLSWRVPTLLAGRLMAA